MMSLLLDSEKENSFPRPDSLALCHLDRALVEMVEEIEIDWPEFLPMERIRPGITEVAFGLLLVIGLVALCAFHWP
jgi:hypothetical protein